MWTFFSLWSLLWGTQMSLSMTTAVKVSPAGHRDCHSCSLPWTVRGFTHIIAIILQGLYHAISYCIILYYIVSYHIISYHISYIISSQRDTETKRIFRMLHRRGGLLAQAGLALGLQLVLCHFQSRKLRKWRGRACFIPVALSSSDYVQLCSDLQRSLGLASVLLGKR